MHDLPPDAVFVNGIEFEASHGFTAQERRATRRFRCHIEMRRDLEAAARSDRLGDTVDYRRVCQMVLDIGTRRTFRLIETLAGAILDAVHAEFPDAAVIVTLEKLHPPCPGAPLSSAVRLSRPPKVVDPSE